LPRIHGFAGAGVNAAVHGAPGGQPKIGVWNYNEVDEVAILDGRTYANIHSGNFPGGEIRGQIVPFNALLGASQETPVNASTGSGWAIATIDPVANMLNYHVFYEGLTGAVVASHFHGNANYGTGTGVKVAIPSVASPIIGSVPYLEADEGALMSGRWYVNLHTALNPGGEIRGQLVPRVIPMDALQEVPVNAAFGSAGFGLVAIDTAANVLGYDVRVVALSSRTARTFTGSPTRRQRRRADGDRARTGRAGSWAPGPTARGQRDGRAAGPQLLQCAHLRKPRRRDPRADHGVTRGRGAAGSRRRDASRRRRARRRTQSIRRRRDAADIPTFAKRHRLALDRRRRRTLASQCHGGALRAGHPLL
jgi:hypothetical protein